MGGNTIGSESNTNEFRADPDELTSQTYVSGCVVQLKKPVELQVAELKDIVAELVKERKNIDALKDWIKKDGKKHWGKGLDSIQGEYKEFLVAVKDYAVPEIVPQFILDYIKKVEKSDDGKTKKEGYKLVITGDGTRYESVLLEGKPYFLHRTKKAGFGFDEYLGNMVPIEGEVFKFQRAPIAKDAEGKSELYNLVLREVEYYTGLHGAYAHLVTCFILLSYQQSRFRVLPIMNIHAPTGSKKTAILNLTGFLSYRSTEQVSLTIANIFRFSSRGISYSEEKPVCLTLIEDEADDIDDSKEKDKLKMYKCTNSRQTVTRVDGNSGEQVPFSPFFLKICASENPIEDEHFRRRAIQFRLPTLEPQGNIYRIGADVEEHFNEIRCELLAWSLVKGLSKEELDIEIPEKYGGYAEHWRPLLITAYGTDGYKVLREYFDSEIAKRVKQREVSMNGLIADTVKKCMDESNYHSVSFMKIWTTLGNSNGAIQNREETRLIFPHGEEITKKKLGQILGTEFAGKPDQSKEEGGRIWIFDKGYMEKEIYPKYGV